MSSENSPEYPLDLLQYIEFADTEEFVKKAVVAAFQRECSLSLIMECWADKMQVSKELGQITDYSLEIHGAVAYSKDEDEIRERAASSGFDVNLALQCWREKEIRWPRMNALRAERLAQAQAKREAEREHWRKEKQAKMEEAAAELSRQINSIGAKLVTDKDKSADKRAQYSQKITVKEQELDDLSQLGRDLEDKNNDCLAEAKRNFEESEENFRQRSSYPSSQAQRQQNVIEEAYAHLRTVIDQQTETFQDSSWEVRNKIEQNIEELYKEKEALPW